MFSKNILKYKNHNKINISNTIFNLGYQPNVVFPNIKIGLKIKIECDRFYLNFIIFPPY